MVGGGSAWESKIGFGMEFTGGGVGEGPIISLKEFPMIPGGIVPLVHSGE